MAGSTTSLIFWAMLFAGPSPTLAAEVMQPRDFIPMAAFDFEEGYGIDTYRYKSDFNGWNTTETNTSKFLLIKSKDAFGGGLAAPDGMYYLGLHNQGKKGGYIKRTVAVKKGIVYALRFKAASRPRFNSSILRVSLDGQNVSEFIPGNQFENNKLTFTAQDTKLTIQFENVRDNMDSCAFLDDVTIEQVSTPSPTPAPTPKPPLMTGLKQGGGWTVDSGNCSIDLSGKTVCVVSPNYPADYGLKQKCTMSVSGTVTFKEFATEMWFDWLQIDQVKYSGPSLPPDTDFNGSITWSSDFWWGAKGWKFCKKPPLFSL